MLVGKVRESWSVSSVVVISVIGLCGLALMVLAVVTAVTEVWGRQPFVVVGVARHIQVWLAWIGVVIGLVGGGSLVTSSAGYLIRVVRGQVPRALPSRESRRRRDEKRKRDYDARKAR